MKRTFFTLVFQIAFMLQVVGQVYAETIIFEENFENYEVGSTPTQWFVQRNYQWGNFYKKCMNGSAPAEWKIVNVDGNNKVKIQINGPSCQMEISPTGLQIPDTSNYKYDFDMTFIDNVNRDRNIVFRYIKGDQWYGIKLENSNYINFVKVNLEGFDHLGNVTYSSGFSANNTYHFSIVTKDNVIKLYINNELIYEVTDQNPILESGTIALQASIGTLGETTTLFDNIVVTDLSKPKVNLLNIPFFSQLDSQWAETTYDSANTWAETGHQGIKDWGCALTSAAMVLNYRGFTTTPDGAQNLTPDTLNTYLKNNGGYTSNGFLIWPALSSLTKQAKDAGHATDTATPIDYQSKSYDKNTVIADLQSGQPSIIKMTAADSSTHFVTAKGWDVNNEIYLNDPIQTSDTNPVLEEIYSDQTYTKVGQLINSSDPSYIWMYIHNPKAGGTLKKDNKTLGTSEGIEKRDFDHSDYSLESKGSGSANSSQSWLYTIPRFESGTYTLSLSSPEITVLPIELFIFDRQTKQNHIQPSFVTGTSGRNIQITVDNTDSSKTNIAIESNLTTLKDTIQFTCNNHAHLKKFCSHFIKMVTQVEKVASKYPWISFEMLDAINHQFKQYEKHNFITTTEYQLIHDEIDRITNNEQVIKHCWPHPFFPRKQQCHHK